MSGPCIKVRHATRESAEHHRARLVAADLRRGRESKPGRLAVYRCPACSTPDGPVWHVGHRHRRCR